MLCQQRWDKRGVEVCGELVLSVFHLLLCKSSVDAVSPGDGNVLVDTVSVVTV